MAYAPALTCYAQALGAARSGQPERARAALERLQKIESGLRASPVPGPYDWAAQIESMRRAAEAWLAYGAGLQEDAVRLARSAAELEEKTGKHPVTPGPPLPARELLGDLFFEMGRPAEAFEAYQASLRESPNRFNSLAGAARAADAAKKPELARPLAERLVQQCVPDSNRPELAEARRILASGG
jgi:tetratricopeptide (TPR) repeat protein